MWQWCAAQWYQVTESACFEGSQPLPACYFGWRRNMERWSNSIDTWRIKYPERNLAHCYFLHHNLHGPVPRRTGASRLEATWRTAVDKMNLHYTYGPDPVLTWHRTRYASVKESVNAVEENDGCENYTKFISALCGYSSASSLLDLTVRILTTRVNIGYWVICGKCW